MAIKENLNIQYATQGGRVRIPPTADGRLLRKHAVFALEYYSTSSLYEGAAINNARRCMIMRSPLLREEEEQTMLQIWRKEQARKLSQGKGIRSETMLCLIATRNVMGNMLLTVEKSYLSFLQVHTVFEKSELFSVCPLCNVVAASPS